MQLLHMLFLTCIPWAGQGATQATQGLAGRVQGTGGQGFGLT